MSHPVQIRRLLARIAMIAVAGLLSACQTPSAPKDSAAADTEAETFEERRGDAMGDGSGGGMGNY